MEVPFGKANKKVVGVVVGKVITPERSVGANSVRPQKSNKSAGDWKSPLHIKQIIKILDEQPILTEELIKLARTLSDNTLCTFYQSIKAIMPSQALSKDYSKSKLRKYVRLIDKEYVAKTGAQESVIDELYSGESLLSELNASAVKTLEKKGIVEIFEKEEIRHSFDVAKYKKTKKFQPTKEQKKAIDAILKYVPVGADGNPPVIQRDDCHRPLQNNNTFLLYGVTGSGKTEVFLQVIERVLEEGKEAIVLVPEISLTPQMVERFVSRFGDKVSVLHSSLSKGEKFDEWQKMLKGQTKIAIGARSAIFAPFQNIGIIIVDEEQETSYKSDMSPKYDARDVAIIRAKTANCPLVLASATPSINSFYKAKQGEYKLLELPTRTNNKAMPEVSIVDMRKELLSGNMSMFSEQLKHEIRENLGRGEQTILLLNRRGYNTFVSCRNCGESIKCNNCDITMTYHKYKNKLICHTCGESKPNPKVCPECGSHYIRYFGDGTQKVEAEIQKYFPEASYIRMDYDSTATKGGHEAVLDKFRDKHIDILVGTQMVAKGLDFPDVTLSAVLAADQSLGISDFRAFERSFSLFTQVCGRAGRAGKKGRAIIQSYTPEHYVLQYAKDHNYTAFYEKEIELRKRLNNPPFSDIIMFLAVGEDEGKLRKVLEESVREIKNVGADGNPPAIIRDDGNRLLQNSLQLYITPISPAPIEKIKGLLRYRCLIKTKMTKEMSKKLLEISKKYNKTKDYLFNIYINPTSML